MNDEFILFEYRGANNHSLIYFFKLYNTIKVYSLPLRWGRIGGGETMIIIDISPSLTLPTRGRE